MLAEDGMDLIAPATVPVQFRGEVLTVAPLVVGKLPAFSRLVRPVVADFFSGQHPEWLSSDDAMFNDIMELHGEAVIEALAIAVDRPADFIGGTQDAAELLALARTVVEENRDFFIRAVRASQIAQAKLQSPPIDGAGPTPSTSSSEPAIH